MNNYRLGDFFMISFEFQPIYLCNFYRASARDAIFMCNNYYIGKYSFCPKYGDFTVL